MNLKKNNISYLAWLFLLFFTGASCAFFGLILAQKSNMNVLLIAGGLVTLFFIVVFGLYLLIGHFLEKKHYLGIRIRGLITMCHPPNRIIRKVKK